MAERASGVVIRCGRTWALALAAFGAAVAGAGDGPAPRNLFRDSVHLSSPAPRKPGLASGGADDSVFMPGDAAFRVEGGSLVFLAPKEGAPRCHAGLGPFPAPAMRRLALSFRANLCQGGGDITFSVTFFGAGQPLGWERILTIYRDEREKYTTRMARREVDFATPPGADALVLWVEASARPGQDGRKQIVLRDLALWDRGRMNALPAGKWLLPFGADSRFEDGKAPGLVAGAGVAAAASEAGPRALRLTMERGGDKFIRFHTPPALLDGCWTEWSFRARGRGVVTPGVWWRLNGVTWDYWHDHAASVPLGDEWQRVVTRRYCVDPSVEYAACTFTVQSEEADFEVDDLCFRVLPEDATGGK